MNIAQELLTKFNNMKGIAQATLEELLQVKGISLGKAQVSLYSKRGA